MNNLALLTTENIGRLWPLVSPYLAAALEFSAGEMSVDQMRLLVVQGQTEVLARMDDEKCTGAIAYEFRNTPNFRIAFVTAIGGRGAYDKTLMGPWCEYLKARGVQRLEGAARPAIARLLRRLGMHEAYTVMRMEI